MTILISFKTAKFSISKETPNPINPIAGQGVLDWLREELAATPWEATAPKPEDWGWYMYVRGSDNSYMVGASGEAGESPMVDWTIQVHKRRSLVEKLTGRNKLTREDPLSRLVEDLVRGDPDFANVEIRESA